MVLIESICLIKLMANILHVSSIRYFLHKIVIRNEFMSKRCILFVIVLNLFTVQFNFAFPVIKCNQIFLQKNLNFLDVDSRKSLFKEFGINMVKTKNWLTHQVLGETPQGTFIASSQWITMMLPIRGKKSALQEKWPSESMHDAIWTVDGGVYIPGLKNAVKVKMKLIDGYVFITDEFPNLLNLNRLWREYQSNAYIQNNNTQMSEKQKDEIQKLLGGTGVQDLLPKDLNFYEFFRIAGIYESDRKYAKIINLYALETANVIIPKIIKDKLKVEDFNLLFE